MVTDFLTFSGTSNFGNVPDIGHLNSWYFYRFSHTCNYFENFIKDHKNDFTILF